MYFRKDTGLAIKNRRKLRKSAFVRCRLQIRPCRSIAPGSRKYFSVVERLSDPVSQWRKFIPAYTVFSDLTKSIFYRSSSLGVVSQRETASLSTGKVPVVSKDLTGLTEAVTESLPPESSLLKLPRENSTTLIPRSRLIETTAICPTVAERKAVLV